MSNDGWVMPSPGWTCPECGFVFDDCVPATMAESARGFARKYRAPLTRGLPGEDLDALLRTRPAPEHWSALEYACHSRDVFLVADHRVATMLAEDRPTFERWDPESSAIELDYNGEDPAVAAAELAEAAEALAARLETVPDDGWARTAARDDVELTVDWTGRNAIHEGTHHLLDVARTVRAARGR
jgi:hypothetical protein